MSSPQIHIEKAGPELFNVSVKLLADLYSELGEESSSIQSLTVSLLEELTKEERTEIFIARTESDEYVGIMTISESQSIYAGGKYGSLDEMYVSPNYRNLNIGGHLIEFLVDHAKQKNWKRIEVTAPTEERWRRTQSFYKKNGFHFTGPKLKLIL